MTKPSYKNMRASNKSLLNKTFNQPIGGIKRDISNTSLTNREIKDLK